MTDYYKTSYYKAREEKYLYFKDFLDPMFALVNLKVVSSHNGIGFSIDLETNERLSLVPNLGYKKIFFSVSRNGAITRNTTNISDVFDIIPECLLKIIVFNMDLF